MFIAEISSDASTTVEDIVELKGNDRVHDTRISSIEVQVGRNEARIVSGQAAIDTRLQTIEASLHRLEEWIIEGRSADKPHDADKREGIDSHPE